MKALKWLDDHFEEALLAVFLVLIACVMMLQVIVRKIPFIDLTVKGIIYLINDFLVFLTSIFLKIYFKISLKFNALISPLTEEVIISL